MSIRTDSREGMPFVQADIALIERVLENLLDNALRHTPEGGMVTVSLSSGDLKMTVRVADSGRGISQKDLPYIFDRFYRGEDNQSETSEGAGLGLAIAKRILEIHGSRIEVVSALGAGTTFTFDLPLSGH
ncbi:MAG: ATP-binding protein [Nitrospirales bacterium]|nr:ATP-binding protein [Nitrospirales bacterium]